jgi:hypothetical protein
MFCNTQRELRLQEREAKLQNWQSSLQFKEASLESLRLVRGTSSFLLHRDCSDLNWFRVVCEWQRGDGREAKGHTRNPTVRYVVA